MIDNNQLKNMSSVLIEAADIGDLVEISSVDVNKQLPKEMRILKFIEEIKNPYCFRVGENIVKLEFSAPGVSLQNALAKSTDR